MCGICGVFTESPADDLHSVVSDMSSELVHRGPDEQGAYSGSRVCMAMRRLSIIDVAGGHQPIENEDGQLVIVFNGEIYNFPELREMLIERGHRFQTNSDTEVILHLYEDESENTPKFLRGMFAFCIYDKRAHSLFLARDRFGEKPLYYHASPELGFAFSSEIKSLLAHRAIPRRLDYEALGYLLRAGFVPAPLTMFRDVRLLPPGNWLRWRDRELTIRPYFRIDYRPDSQLDDPTVALEAVQEQLRRSVERQAISDVPIGALLSGGIDSSAVAATLQAVSTRPIKTFTVRFEDKKYDESEVARQVAKHLGTEHHEFVLTNAAFEQEDLWRIVDHVGMPFLDSSAIPTYILSKYVAGEVKVALSGDGGDELFAGYDFFQWGLAIRRIQKWPAPLLRGGASVADWAGHLPWLSGVAGLRRLRRGLQCASGPRNLLPIAMYNSFDPAELTALIRNETLAEVATGSLPLLTELPDNAQHWSPLRQLMYFYLKFVLPDQLLTKVDRMSMATSLEVRAPLLDADLADLSMRLPDKHLIQNGVGKDILRKAVRKSLPEVVFKQPKRGFDIPLHQFQNEQYRATSRDLLCNGSEVTQLFDRRQVNELVETGLSQKMDSAQRSVFRSSHQLWGLMQLSAWQQRFEVSL